jgi:hypothetical protein
VSLKVTSAPDAPAHATPGDDDPFAGVEV